MTYEEAIAAGYAPASEPTKAPTTYEEAVRLGYVPAQTDGGASSEGAPQPYGAGEDTSTPRATQTTLPITPSSLLDQAAGDVGYLGRQLSRSASSFGQTVSSVGKSAKDYADVGGTSATAKAIDKYNPVSALTVAAGAPGPLELANIAAQNTLGRFWHDGVQPILGGAFKAMGDLDQQNRNYVAGDISGVAPGTTNAVLKKPKMDSSQYLARRFLEFYGGADWAPEAAGEGAVTAAKAGLEKKLGTYGAPAAEFVAGTAGQGPLLFLPAGKAAEAGTMLGAIKNAAFINSAFAVANRQDPVVAAGAGAVLGGTIHAGLDLKPIARIQPDALTNELMAMLESQTAERAAPTYAGEAAKLAVGRSGPVTEVKGPRPAGPPVAAALASDSKGNPKLVEFWLRFNAKSGQLEWHPHETANPTAAQVQRAHLESGAPVGIDLKSPQAGPRFGDDALRLIDAAEASSHPVEDPRAIEVPPLQPGSTGVGSPGRLERNASTLVSPVPEDATNTARTLVANSNGELRQAYSSAGGRFSEVQQGEPVRLGDVATVNHAGGQIPGVRVIAISRDGSQVRVRRGTTSEWWPSESVTPGGASDEAAHFADEANSSATPGPELRQQGIRTFQRRMPENDTPSVERVGKQVQSWGYVTPDRLAARYNISKDEAAALAQELKDSGFVSGGAKGIYPTKSVAGMNVELPEHKGTPGMTVYWGAPVGKDKLQPAGALRGQDPFNKGRWLVEIKPGVKISLSADEFNTARPVTLGDRDKARLPAEAGITYPLPPGVTQPQSPTSHAAMQFADELKARLEKRQGIAGPMGSTGFTRAIWNATHDDIYRGASVPWSVRSGVRTNNTEAVTQHVMGALKAIGMNPAADLALNALLPMDPGGRRDAALSAFVTKYPAEARAVQQTIRDLLAERDANEAAIVAEGLDPSGVIAAKQSARSNTTNDQYVRKTYGVHLSARGNFAEFVKNQMPAKWLAATRYLEQEARAAGFQGAQSARATQTLSEMMNEDPVEALRRSGMVAPKVAATWKTREQLPPVLRDVLGEVHSGSINLAYTTATLREQVRTLRAFKKLTQSPWWSRGQRADLTVPIPNEPKYGLAAGGYTTPDLAWMVKAPDVSAHGFAFAQALGRFWKQNVTVLGGPGPWLNNVMRNIPYSVALGTIDPADGGLRFANEMKESARLMGEYRKNPSMLGPGGAVAEALDYGAVTPGMMAVEGSKFKARTERQVMDALRQSKSQTPWDLVSDAASHKLDDVKDAYDSIDQIFKLTSYRMLRKKALAQGMNVHDAAAFASLRVNESYPNFSLPSPLAKAMSSKFGYAAPFATSKLEDLRVQGNIAARVLKGDRETMWNLGKAAMFAGAVKGGLDSIRKANGVTDSDVAAAEQSLPVSTKGYKPGMVAMPMLDSKGHVTFVDLSAYLDPAMAARGSVDDPLWQRLVLGTANDLFGQGVAQTPLNTLAASTGFAPQSARQQLVQSNRNLPVQGDTGIETLLPMLAASFGPQLPFRLYSSAEQAGHGSQPGLGYTDGEMVSKFLGVPVAGVGSPEEAAARNKQFVGFAKDLKSNIVKGAIQNKSNPEKQRKVIGAQVEMMQQRAKETFGGGGSK